MAKCKMCGKPLKRLTLKWWESVHHEIKPMPVKGKMDPLYANGIVQEILRDEGVPGNRRIVYWCGAEGYHGRGYFCSLKCGYEWALDEIRQIEGGLRPTTG